MPPSEVRSPSSRCRRCSIWRSTGTATRTRPPEYADALASLYPLAYALKFLSKADLGRDYVVPPLEALWSAQDMATFTTARDKSQWDWTLLSLVPDWLSADRCRDGA